MLWLMVHPIWKWVKSPGNCQWLCMFEIHILNCNNYSCVHIIVLPLLPFKWVVFVWLRLIYSLFPPSLPLLLTLPSHPPFLPPLPHPPLCLSSSLHSISALSPFPLHPLPHSPPPTSSHFPLIFPSLQPVPPNGNKPHENKDTWFCEVDRWV